MMLGVVLGLFIAAATLVSGEISSWDGSLRDAEVSQLTLKNSGSSQREGKFFPLFSVVRFANSECSGSNSFNGTCYTRRECASYGGTGYGTCANKLGVCCVFRQVCGTTTDKNNTYFVNPNYPITYDGGERCVIKVTPCNSNICQLRIDFLDFNLAQPNASGVCDYDFLLISGGSARVPRICGDNVNEHVYVEFNGENPIVISIDTDPDYKMDRRRWNMRFQQIACDSPWRAPNGCLQYYNGVTGSVKSFNYGTVPNPRVSASLGTAIGTRQLLHLNYGVCVRMALGYCAIEWSQSDSYSFAVSGDSAVFDPSAVDDFAVSGTMCTTNYVIIPNPSVNGTRLDSGRFCGNGFPTKTTFSKPFVMWVVTNPTTVPPAALTDFENRGFILKYRQLPCPLNF